MVDVGFNKVVNETLGDSFRFAEQIIPEEYLLYVTLGVFLIAVVLYSIFVWKFYRFLAKRDILELNLSQYNHSSNALSKKLTAIFFFIIEYIVVLPIVVFFWFFVIAIILLVLAREQPLGVILLISAVIIGAIRITAYYSEDLSKDLAKIFPFTILVIAMTTPGFFSVELLLAKIYQIPSLFAHTFIYLIVIIVIEFLLRMVWLIFPSKSDSEKKKGYDF